MVNLKFIALSGSTGVTENLYVYEYGDDLIMVDCGVGFPEPEMYGIDLVIPDFSYLRSNRKKLKAIFISHGHEDHLGALPFLLREFKVPVYGTKLTIGFINDKLEDYKVFGAKLKVIDPEGPAVRAGNLSVTPFRIAHSVPDAVGFVIDTPVGKVFHVPDYKFDWTPVDGKPFDIARASMLAAEGVLALASDSLGSTTPGYTESEKTIEGEIENIVKKSHGKVFFTTVSSNISRMQQAINVAVKYNRKVCFAGRSIERKAEIAKSLGYLNYKQNWIVSLNKLRRANSKQIMFIISGSYGQMGSTLYKVALGEHKKLSLSPQDTVIFSADPAPPGSKQNVDYVVDRLIESGVDVHYYDIQENLHVSGHGSQNDIRTLFGLVKPKYFIPIGGTIRHNRAYSEIAQGMGARKNQVFELSPGEVLEFGHDGSARRGKSVSAREILIDGLEVGGVDSIVLRDRKILAEEGVVIVVIKFDTVKRQVLESLEIISRGFVFEKAKREFLRVSAQKLVSFLNKKQIRDSHTLKAQTVNFLEMHFERATGRRPMILPAVIEL
ncbi:MAG: hypothetical protein UV74_C0013G0543 [Candidatus Woesebacteria bacterium GW2011_GWB1_43_14]|uniref:Metallo-beta-lactamase domain-containing protein n=1 Tax=Candidatus Woesebacteria bacterium GW2011_GWB1_43_14 TaxID=1618578 RepID=A0A0G1FQV6_9BACT|nr:MAG: hypothetical protein UT21_C0001G0256 [Candidatus Woesebacteria bacterium GW2011_GWA1_39_11b]KKS77999.1 MAG: hypothetical protein UV51_C0003G0034 [Candidatus Woesebacteria bacterium GW2011_GWC1_42_9]KKS97421.1 MAG: hypothetical protein UV74_C0013G0543 [Candidatus Woesebacteria bacterium GW2011_GWB1_43_14]